ncbi:hypothetical protein C8J56DRAFT_1058062 [Mycena floridula]|nr:hypothetical protein C8J56DRAFT_1058062 [Mycena floridula]
MSSAIEIDLHPGHEVLSVVINADYAQRREFKLYRIGAVGASATFEERGV